MRRGRSKIEGYRPAEVSTVYQVVSTCANSSMSAGVGMHRSSRLSPRCSACMRARKQAQAARFLGGLSRAKTSGDERIPLELNVVRTLRSLLRDH